MTERTEEQKVALAPIQVVLGGVDYNVEQLRIKDSRPWRKKVSERLGTLPQYFESAKADLEEHPEELGKTLTGFIEAMPDVVIDLFFDYAKDLDRSKIEAEATDKEITLAFREVVKVAFPLFEMIPKVMENLAL